MNTLDLASRRVEMKKVSNTNCGEWQGPCPGCGGKDRFHVWPKQNDDKGGYWCRQCGKHGDNIQFLRDFEGMSFVDACNYLNIPLPERGNPSAASRGSAPGGVSSFGNGGPGSGRNPSLSPPRPEFIPNEHAAPADLWQEKAMKFVTWAQGNLARNDDALAWLSARGISAETAVNFRLGWNPGEEGKDIYRARQSWGLPEVLRDDGRPKALWIPRGLVIPHIVDGVIYRLRIRRPDDSGPRYYVIPGSSMSIMTIEPSRRAFVIVESELDAIAIAAACPLVGAVALGSVAAKPDADTTATLRGAVQILNALDYDAAGAKAMTWWADHFPNCERWPVPSGKDPGEAVKLGIDLDTWIKAGLPPVLTIGKTVAKDRDVTNGVANKGLDRETAAKSGKDQEKQAQDAVKMSENRRKAEDLRAKEAEIIEKMGLSPLILELRDLLRNNPRVKIINTADRYTVLKDGKYVGGRINHLVFREEATRDYLISHPCGEIDARNLIIMGEKAISELRHSG
jgi:hypothetical protein